MDIQAKEIKEIKDIGELHGDKVKMLLTTGGLYMVVGKRTKTQKSSEPLAAGSHPGLVMHQLEKQFTSDFRPSLRKSETETLESINEMQLEETLVSKGFQLFRIHNLNKVDIVLTKFLKTVAKCEMETIDNSLQINKIEYENGILEKETSKNIISNSIKKTLEELDLSIKK